MIAPLHRLKPECCGSEKLLVDALAGLQGRVTKSAVSSAPNDFVSYMDTNTGLDLDAVRVLRRLTAAFLCAHPTLQAGSSSYADTARSVHGFDTMEAFADAAVYRLGTEPCSIAIDGTCASVRVFLCACVAQPPLTSRTTVRSTVCTLQSFKSHAKHAL